MDRSLKWRTIGLLLIILTCVGILLPSVADESLPSWFPFKKKINWGLDLQGGTHIVYSIDLDRAIEDRATRIRQELEAKLAEDKLKGTVKTPQSLTGAVTVILEGTEDATATPAKDEAANPAAPKPAAAKADAGALKQKLDEIKSYIKSTYPGQTEDRECAPTDGPVAYCLIVSPKYAEDLKQSALTNAVDRIRERIDEKGVAEPTVIKKDDQIIVELPGLDKEAREATLDIIRRSAKLEFKIVENNSEYMSEVARQVGFKGKDSDPTDEAAKMGSTDPKDWIRVGQDVWRKESGGDFMRDNYLRARDRAMDLPREDAVKIGCIRKTEKLLETTVRCAKVEGRRVIEMYLASLAKKDPKFVVPEGYQVAYEKLDPSPDDTDKSVFWRSYYLDRTVKLTGQAISSANPGYDPQTNRPVVYLDFDRQGTRDFGKLTTDKVGWKFATILDDLVKSAPVINVPILQGRASITMGGGNAREQEKERDELVNVLRTGSLPAPLQQESVSDLGATLGRDAIDKTQVSFGVGIVLVILIMVGIYRWSGWIAVFSLVFHNLLTIAIMVLFGATLTLPGIAAIVLSVGMCVDGNILIYERIRDELRLGKSVRGAVDLGFSRAFSAILDGQLTTAAGGWVLLQYGSGPIKGFAVMLLVGIFTTITTNTWVTRIFFDWYIAKKKGQMATISI
jgi:preprotein translocase subunit SecD